MTPVTPPSVSIGLPVYNGGESIATCLESLLAQSHGDIEIIVSDNASTDDTGEIVEAFAARDSRIRYFRQPSNIGAHANFGFVLDVARGNYFMWAADDDLWDPRYVAENMSFLESNEGYVTSVSMSAFHDSDFQFPEPMGTVALTRAPADNIETFLLNPGANSRFYGLHRREALRQAWHAAPIWAADWLVMCRTLLIGKHHEIPEVLFTRGAHGTSSNAIKAITSSNRPWVHKLFPMLAFSLSALRLREVRSNSRLIWHVLVLNYKWTRLMLSWVILKRFKHTGDRSE